MLEQARTSIYFLTSSYLVQLTFFLILALHPSIHLHGDWAGTGNGTALAEVAIIAAVMKK